MRAWITKALALFFALYAAYCTWTLFYQVSLVAIVVIGVCGSAAFGLWLKRPWSQYVVYFISAMICLYFPWYVWTLLQRAWPYESGARSLMSLLPAALLFVFGVVIAVHVRRVFRKHSA